MRSAWPVSRGCRSLNKFVFGDESGCLSFSRQANESRYFILCTIVMDETGIDADLLKLRQELVWRKVRLNDYFHASVDLQEVRDAVFKRMLKWHFSIQATIVEKSKAEASLTKDLSKFYNQIWYLHFEHGVRNELLGCTDFLIAAASLGKKKERTIFKTAFDDAIARSDVKCNWATDFPSAATSPSIQVADYCAWAFRRKWELNDSRSYDLIKDRITYEKDIWEHSDKHYY
jgi:Protein of unknown function (DUF3800)